MTPSDLDACDDETAWQQDEAQAPCRSSIANALQFLLIVGVSSLAIWTAWDFGGGFRRTQSLAVWILLGLMPLLLLSIALRGTRVSRPPLLTWLALTVWLLGLLQCVPLPDSLTQLLSPASQQAYRHWLPESLRGEALALDQPAIRRIATDSVPISVSPTHTRIALSIPLVFAAVCWLGSICFRDRRLVVLFLGMTTIAAASFSFFGLADTIRLQRDREVELRQRLIISPVGADDPFGPFVNNNNGANYLNLGIGCALGLLTVTLGYRLRPDPSRRSFKVICDHDAAVPADPSRSSRRFGESLKQWRLLLCGLLIVLMATGVLASGSRGAFVGLVSAALAIIALTTQRRVRWWASGAIIASAAAVLMLLSWLDMDQHTTGRLQTLFDGVAMEDPRIGHWQDALRAATHALPAGSGFGAYRYGYLPFQRSGGGGWFINADGMPVEWLVEGGVWLPLIALAGLIVTWIDIRYLVRRGCWLPMQTARVARMVAVTALFVTIAMLSSQTFDFGVLLFPLLITLALIVGAVVALARAAKECEPCNEVETRRKAATSGLTATVLAALLLVPGLTLAAIDLHVGAMVEQLEIERGEAASIPWAQRESQAEAIERVTWWLEYRPTDAELHRLLALLILDEQRSIGARYLVESEITDEAEASRWTAVSNVRRAFYAADVTQTDGVQALMLPGQEAQQWRLARQHAVAASILCPLDDTTRVMLAELDFLAASQSAAVDTSSLLQTTALLRQRDDRVLRYLQALAETNPDARTLRRIHELRRQLRSGRDSGS